MGYLESLLGHNERIIILTRQHWITLLRTFLVNGFIAIILVASVLMIVIVAILVPKIPVLAPVAVIVPPVLLLLAVVPLILLLYPALRVVFDVVQWWNELYVVTNWRVIQLEGVIRKNATDSSLEKINDVKLVQSAPGRVLDYGDLEILTASESGVNVLQRIASPIKFKTEMLNQKKAMVETGDFESRAPVLTSKAPDTGNIPELIAGLDELCEKGIITEAEFEAKKAELLARI